jgi:hypothetical protein
MQPRMERIFNAKRMLAPPKPLQDGLGQKRRIDDEDVTRAGATPTSGRKKGEDRQERTSQTV